MDSQATRLLVNRVRRVNRARKASPITNLVNPEVSRDSPDNRVRGINPGGNPAKGANRAAKAAVGNPADLRDQMVTMPPNRHPRLSWKRLWHRPNRWRKRGPMANGRGNCLPVTIP